MKKPINHDVEMRRIDAESSKFAHICDLIKKAIQAATVLGCVWLLVYCVVEVAKCKTDSIAALADFVKSLGISRTILGLSNIVWIGLYYKERTGKKRAVAKKGEYQKIVESNEPNRSSSGLTATGDTPQ